MDILNAFLLFFHIMGLAVTLGAAFAVTMLGPMFGRVEAAERGMLFRLGLMLARYANWGLLVMWVTGPLLLWLKWGGFEGISHWFYLKLVFVVIFSATLGINASAFRRFADGDTGASSRVAITSVFNLILGTLAVLSAVFAFG